VKKHKKLPCPLYIAIGYMIAKLGIDIQVYSLLITYPETFTVVGGMLIGVFLLQRHLLPVLTKGAKNVLSNPPEE